MTGPVLSAAISCVVGFKPQLMANIVLDYFLASFLSFSPKLRKLSTYSTKNILYDLVL